MKHSPRIVRVLAAALLSASLLTVGAGAVELDGSSVSAVHVDQSDVPSSATRAVAENESPVAVSKTGNVGQYQVTYQNKNGSETNATITAVKAGADAYVRINVDTQLNVRQGPGTYYSVLCSVDDNTLFPLTGKTGNWYQILCNGRTGYVSGDYAVVMSSQDVFPPAEKAPGNSSTGDTAPSNSKADQIVAYALQYVGYPYVYGKAGPNSFDCSGFTSYVYAHFGYTLHRSSKDQVKDGVAVSKSNLQPADILLFSNGSSGGNIGHVGIYIGNGKFVHASTSSTGVIISDLNINYYVQHYIGARRIL